MPEHEVRLCDADGVAVLVATMAREIASGRRGSEPLRLIGVRTRGYAIAERLANALQPMVGEHIPVGAVDITLYRDDLNQSNRWPVLHGTEIPFPVDGAEIILVDDVLFTGRTVRAALNAICDLGRPARVRLATLIDRGHREFPIQPNIIGLHVDTARDDRVRVRITPLDRVDEIVRLVDGNH